MNFLLIAGQSTVENRETVEIFENFSCASPPRIHQLICVYNFHGFLKLKKFTKNYAI